MREDMDYESPEDEGNDVQGSQDFHEPEEIHAESEGHDDSQDSSEESSEGENENVKPEKISIRERLTQVQRERYQVLQEAENLRLENERLRKSAEISAGQALSQYDENLTRRYENARATKARAMEEGDVQSQIDADADLAMISAEIYQTNYLKAQNNIQSNQYQHAQQPSHQDNTYHVAQWIEENPWFNTSSNDYDPWLASEVDNWCNSFDNNLYRNGQGHLIHSPEYLGLVSRYASSVLNKRNQSGNNRDLNMSQSRSPVSPVRNGYNQNGSRSKEVKINDSEKDMCRRLGISEKDYLQQRLRDEKERPNRRLGGR